MTQSGGWSFKGGGARGQKMNNNRRELDTERQAPSLDKVDGCIGEMLAKKEGHGGDRATFSCGAED